jgi:putative tricarboxylic transport membrane protein
MLMTKDRIGALLMLAFSVAYGLLSYRIPLLPFQEAAAFTARTGPKALAVLGAALSLMLIVKPGGEAPETAGFNWGRGAILCGLMLVYAATVRPFGFIPATTIFHRRSPRIRYPAIRNRLVDTTKPSTVRVAA